MKRKFKDIWKPMLMAALLLTFAGILPNGRKILGNLAIGFAVLVIVFLIAMFLLDKYQKARTPYLTKYLNDCDAKEFLIQCEAGKEKEKADTNKYYAAILNLISAYIVNGSFDSARKWLAYMESKTSIAKKYIENTKNLGVLCAVLEKDYARGKHLLDDMRKMARNQPKNKQLRQKLASAVLMMDAHDGNRKRAKDYYENLFAKGTRNNSERVWCKYHLMAVYESEGNQEKVRECLLYLAEHGNNTYMAEEARKKLSNLQV